MGILRRTANSRKMLQAGRNLLLLQPFHHGSYKACRRSRISSVGTPLHNAAFHVRQVCHRRKIQVESQICQRASDGCAGIIGIPGVSRCTDISRRLHFGSDAGRCHSCHGSTLLVHSQENRILRILLRIRQHFFQLLFRFDILCKINQPAYRIPRQRVPGSFPRLYNSGCTCNGFRRHHKQPGNLILQRHGFDICIDDFVKPLLRRGFRYFRCRFRCHGNLLFICQQVIYYVLLFLLPVRQAFPGRFLRCILAVLPVFFLPAQQPVCSEYNPGCHCQYQNSRHHIRDHLVSEPSLLSLFPLFTLQFVPAVHMYPLSISLPLPDAS